MASFGTVIRGSAIRTSDATHSTILQRPIDATILWTDKMSIISKFGITPDMVGYKADLMIELILQDPRIMNIALKTLIGTAASVKKKSLRSKRWG